MPSTSDTQKMAESLLLFKRLTKSRWLLAKDDSIRFEDEEEVGSLGCRQTSNEENLSSCCSPTDIRQAWRG